MYKQGAAAHRSVQNLLETSSLPVSKIEIVFAFKTFQYKIYSHQAKII